MAAADVRVAAATGLTGNLTAVTDSHGDQVAYNGHLLYHLRRLTSPAR